MKAKVLFLSIFSFSVLAFAGGCEDPITDTEHNALVKQVKEYAGEKIYEVRSLMAGKCISADQMIEYLGLVESSKDKSIMFEILVNKLVKGSDYAKVKKSLDQ